MGAWGTGVFDNDGALDFLTELRQCDPEDRERFIRQTLQTAAGSQDYLDIDDGQMAIVAAAAVAAARAGQPLNSGTDEIVIAPPTPELLAQAVRALDRVTGESSEWRELWGEGSVAGGDMLDTALAAVAEVRTNLL
ncbi:DUF4259 domain-containing protein [Actinopolymorpha alba]|uniref:DUF4259 domain-containing protein n=1 Tax=Actinopolymorpha alba TaxID=533267 RepID=UPI000365BF9C|nr:DUF4259 domain-containing protein [Actinopolymorpha alba]